MGDQEYIEGIDQEATAPGKGLLSGRSRLFLVGFVLLLGIGYLIYAAFPGSTSYYFTVDQLAAFDGEVEGRSFRVKGKLVDESFRREEGSTRAQFALYSGEHQLPATYNGVVPDLFFDDHSEIILQGQYDTSGVFQAETVSVLCPTKYEALAEGDPDASDRPINY